MALTDFHLWDVFGGSIIMVLACVGLTTQLYNSFALRLTARQHKPIYICQQLSCVIYVTGVWGLCAIIPFFVPKWQLVVIVRTCTAKPAFLHSYNEFLCWFPSCDCFTLGWKALSYNSIRCRIMSCLCSFNLLRMGSNIFPQFCCTCTVTVKGCSILLFYMFKCFFWMLFVEVYRCGCLERT